MKKLLPLLFFLALPAFAQHSATTVTKINGLVIYETYGGGEAIFRVDQPAPGCEGGFFLSKSDANFSATWGTILSAFHAKTPILAYGITNQLWTGSTSKFCKLYGIELYSS